ncbi:orotate phosphoribosyltransferase [Pyrococcus abyssi]|uniref:Orotate phosphoribosyltransferase n=1 Tax=Pyrococcus abyssi (strain GE5 / Orsay) TaxID=272844 RepID=PYRE_PYRAB|nr:orotate phosphoribosyltransferase [Pyrococcus abyssi]P0CL79.1 RecName: Full=Orotate phosphoribosyltransferase; Short=OPRT; Short=OPRTase [Pyrococcus abyssi GE5]CAB50015.1 pyrE orotate phosphoribosyl transferase [Pyrococcus abyssi GE5]CCE70518.1 TPA: orotate phosphoribosyltransferase [Pyrococcus abyssi GE5]
MKEELVKLIIDSGCIKFGHFILTSGKESNYYIDIKSLITNPKALKLIAKMIKEESRKLGIEYDKVAGPELGAVPIATALSLETDKPLLIIRKKKKEHGTGKLIEGEISPGDRVLLVEDVTTTGGSVIRAAKILKEHGAEVVGIFVVVDREEGARENIEKEGFKLYPLVLVSDLFEAAGVSKD